MLLLASVTLLGALCGCGPTPVELAEKLTAKDATLAKRLEAAPGTWVRDSDKLTSPGWRSAKMGPNYDVGARLPARADGALEVGIGQSPDYTLRLEPDGARAAAVEDDAGRASYRQAYASTDVVFVGEPKRVQWAGGRLVVRLDASGLSYPILLDPAIESAVWTQTATGTPSARYGHAMVYDSARAKTVLFGGHDNNAYLNDTWEYNGATATWAQVTTTGSPPARYFHAMVYDSARAKTVLFGGYNGGNLNDTWEYNGATATWTQLTTTGSPTARVLHAMVYDSARAVIGHRVLGSRGGSGGGRLGPARPVPLPGVADEADGSAAEQHRAGARAVVSHRVLGSCGGAGGDLLGPVGPVPLPGIAEDGVTEGGAAEQHGAGAGAVVGQRVGNAGRGTGSGLLGPGGPIPLPGVADVVAAAEEDGARAHAVVRHCAPLARSGAGGRHRGPGRSRSVVLPGVAEGAGRAPAAEQDGAGAHAVVRHRVQVAGGGAGDRLLAPVGPVPLPGIAGQAADSAAEQDRACARAVVRHRQAAPRQRATRGLHEPGDAVPFPRVAEEEAAAVGGPSEQHGACARAVVGHRVPRTRRGGRCRAILPDRRLDRGIEQHRKRQAGAVELDREAAVDVGERGFAAGAVRVDRNTSAPDASRSTRGRPVGSATRQAKRAGAASEASSKNHSTRCGSATNTTPVDGYAAR